MKICNYSPDVAEVCGPYGMFGRAASPRPPRRVQRTRPTKHQSRYSDTGRVVTKIFKFLSIFLAVLASSAMALSSVAAETDSIRIATVDVGAVLNSLQESQQRRKEIDQASKKARDQVEKKRAELKKLEELIKSRNLAPDSDEADRLRREAREFDRLIKDSEEELRRAVAQAQQELTGKTLALINRYASANKLDLVLDRSRSSLGPVLFGSPLIDITDQVIAGAK